jgi:hypothetical protein
MYAATFSSPNSLATEIARLSASAASSGVGGGISAEVLVTGRWWRSRQTSSVEKPGNASWKSRSYEPTSGGGGIAE